MKPKSITVGTFTMGTDKAPLVSRALHRALYLMVLTYAAGVAADMIDSSEMKAWEVCALCHGANGISATDKFPKLAGQKQGYIKQQVLDFRSRHRSNDGGQMQAISTEVAAGEIDEVARYFSELNPGDVSAQAAAQHADHFLAGERLFKRGREGVPACVHCHANAQSEAPWLDFQHQAYLQKQLDDFSKGARVSAKSPMESIAEKLTGYEVEAVSYYLSKSLFSRTE